jgi:hypothetical protein
MDENELEQALDAILSALGEETESQQRREEELEEKLLRALDGSYRQIRDDNHVTPEEILVYDETEDAVQPVPVWELISRYPIDCFGARWSYEDLGEIIATKARLYQISRIAHEINEEDPSTQPTCGTVVLAIPTEKTSYRWYQVKANITPEED